MRNSKYDDIKKISIIEYARYIGYTPLKVGSFYTLKEHDSVRINPRRNIYIQNSTGVGGSIIDFAMNFTGKSLPAVIKELCEYGNFENQRTLSSLHEGNTIKEGEKPIKEKRGVQKEFDPPEKDKTYKNVIAYLHKTRGLPVTMIQYMIDKKMLYQDKHKNCVFISYHNGKPVFGCIRGTNTYKKFVADVKGSDYSYCFYINALKKTEENRLVITESVIDTLSLMSLSDKNKEYDYLALSGLGKYKEALIRHLEMKNYEAIVIALDNDQKGEETAYHIVDFLRTEMKYTNKIKLIFPQKYKDWNDMLVKCNK